MRNSKKGSKIIIFLFSCSVWKFTLGIPYNSTYQIFDSTRINFMKLKQLSITFLSHYLRFFMRSKIKKKHSFHCVTPAKSDLKMFIWRMHSLHKDFGVKTSQRNLIEGAVKHQRLVFGSWGLLSWDSIRLCTTYNYDSICFKCPTGICSRAFWSQRESHSAMYTKMHCITIKNDDFANSKLKSDELQKPSNCGLGSQGSVCVSTHSSAFLPFK